MMQNGETILAVSSPSPQPETGRSKMWWKNRSKLERNLIIASIVSAIFVVIILFIYLLASNEPEVCGSSTCVRTSMELLNYMDVKVDPCEDFYRFSCGNFLRNTEPGDNRGSRTASDITADEIRSRIRSMLEQPEMAGDPKPFNSAKRFYGACMNGSAVEAAGLKRTKQIFRQMGGWPTLNGANWREDQFDWKEAVYKLRQIGLNSGCFLILSVQRDNVDPDRYILSLQDPGYNSPSEISKETKSLFLDYMVDLAVFLGADKERARREQEDVMQFMLKLAKIAEEPEGANGTVPSTYNPLSLSELQFAYPDIPWLEYINKILAPSSRITHDDVISVAKPQYLRKLLPLLKNTDKRVLANFISWQTLQQLIKYLPKRILERAYEFLEKAHDKIGRESRWMMCLEETEKRLNKAISAAYVEKYFDEEARRGAISTIRNIKLQFRENLHKLDWLDEKTKEMAVEKVVSSVEDIATRHALVEDSRVYEKVHILEDELLTSALNLDYTNLNIYYGKLRQRVRESLFDLDKSVTGLNIVYSAKDNVLRIPVGIFHGIFFQKDRPHYLNYGALGSVIGHEMFHIIIEAEYRDLKGELRSWWSSNSLLNYEAKLRCLSKHYERFNVARMAQHLNTSGSRDEDLSDLAGVSVSYDAYANWVMEHDMEPLLPGLKYSQKQLFWISSAVHQCAKYSTSTLHRYMANYQLLSPAEFRVNNVVQNLDQFALDFGCPVGSKMNPEEKCRIW